MKQLALLKLLQIPQLGPQRIARLLNQIDFAEFCQYSKTELQQMGWNDKQIQCWFQPEMRWIDRAITWAEQPNQRLVTLFDKDYPFLLQQISTAPLLLFVRGSVASLTLLQIAIVGSRDYSPYGEYWASYFTRELIEQGFAVTSGLAIGIDGFCHQQAVKQQAVTIAVLGSGLDQVYPARHKKLAEQIIANGGALVSEFFPDQPPLAEHFPRRNRIISGLSLGTLVVEATINSGSLITARYALEQGREVFALPNTAQNPYAAGCHQLIKEGAILTESIADILQAIQHQYRPSAKLVNANSVNNSPNIANQQLTIPLTDKTLPDLTACQQQIMQNISFTPIAIDDLAKATDIAVEILLVELLGLELLGMIKQVCGGYVVTQA
ncbi:DNA-processing protein DprA [[Haemophilus] ducreyi]|uniref:DNA-processing protein DprA n=1 Tax=Haemophilus ducreyi TaxID=730 RepID=UPI000655035A|nr:DNA-processing protein DprA [[Haemophilus] ducreyi]AKO45937.1 DNA repair protein Smf [[Haemophilus] ducreyi]AKO47296.1 DNA repair protein Smf [[Haemophilus] ducreyi]AKO48662.1 DNA repair protein Smf [[Haemophilus] ducreyi]AKO50033.1 DNA repair protein Smf [[Haemophilus] ducreyi]ANF61945.1 DNA processing protein DprA [[Haemophilus] ducreyi]